MRSLNRKLRIGLVGFGGSDMADIQKKEYDTLISDIGTLLSEGRKKAFHTVDSILVNTYWNIGKRIVRYEQRGQEKAEYGSRLLKDLLRDLRLQYGKGFSRSNLQYMRQLYTKFPKYQTLSGKLT